MKSNNIGWIVAAGLIAALVASGFQTQPTKIGVVDMQSVFQTSDYFKDKQNELKNMGDTRSAILEFLQTYPTITAAQAQRFRDLSLKPDLTGAEKTELEKIKSDVIATDQSFKALQTKASPTPAEVTQLQSYNNQQQQTQTLSQTWAQEFNQELNDEKGKLSDDVRARLKDAVQDVAKKQGYTVVFTSDAVPFGSNDVTADTLKVMNAKK